MTTTIKISSSSQKRVDRFVDAFIRTADKHFHVTIHETYRVHGCAEKQAEEARGMFGFHSFTRCPDCRVEREGWQAWGENGHQQNQFADLEHLTFWLRRKAVEQWRAKNDGTLWGYRFRKGGAIYFKGN